MAITITSAGLIAAYPEWAQAPAGVLANAIAVANARPLQLYTDADEETNRRYLEAGALLYTMPFARDLHRPDQGEQNPYRMAADELDRLKGTAYRAPGWSIPAGVP
jgi:ABC-type nitrate/sulfonate/bicarbonate transport system substrate-binding protein